MTTSLKDLEDLYDEVMVNGGGFYLGPENYPDLLEWSKEYWGDGQVACAQGIVGAYSSRDLLMLELVQQWVYDSLSARTDLPEDLVAMREWCIAQIVSKL